MKWAYLPIMFALAFIYTKFSFNEYNEKKEVLTETVSRKPASVATNALLQKVPLSLFYKNLKNEELKAFAAMSLYKGTILGDVHVEAFGFVIDDQKRARFSMTEFNEVSTGILYYDVLGHLISSKTLDKRVSWIDYFEAYKKGLRNENYTYSFYVSKGLEESFLNSAKLIDENISSEMPFEFTKLKKTHRATTSQEKSKILGELVKLFPKIQLFDLQVANLNKGSYEALVRCRPQDKVEWLGIKEMSHARYDMIFGKGIETSAARRFELVKSDVLFNEVDKSLFFFEINNEAYSMRFADHFMAKIDFEQIPADDYHDILMDEAYTLGKIHRVSLGDQVGGYIKDWAKIPAATVDEKTVELKYKLQDYFN